jgi:tetratricopeptide (TPR) repeat protein
MTEKKEFILTKDDFVKSGWQTIIEGIEQKECRNYSSAFHSRFNDTSDEKTKEIFLLLTILLTSELRLDSPDNPFANIDRLNNKHLEFFAEIIEVVSDDEIKSRMADVLWLRTKNHKMAEIAVVSYLNSANTLEDFANWTQTQRRIERALQLASMLGKTRELYQQVLDRIYDLLERCNGEDPLYLSAQLMRLLQERREGDAEKYAQFCEKLALNAEGQNDFHKAQIYWETKAGWHYQSKDNNAATDARTKIAESYEKESDFNLENRQPKYMMACHPIEQAIIAYRKLGNVEKVEELKLKLRGYQAKSMEEMIPINSGSFDISEIYIQSENAVSGKSFIDSLKILASSIEPNNLSQIRKQVEENRKTYLGSSIFPKKLHDANGRVIGVQPSEGEEAILADMFEYARYSYEIRTKGIVEPARLRILLEHSARGVDFYEYLMNHPLIPENREFIVARGLHAGLNGDFLTATHFLIPQLEESLRYILIGCGIVPSSFDEKGIQDEYNLNKLLTHSKFTSKLTEIFGENLVFDLRGLLVERFGANLRNDMAHGLIDHNNFYSYASIYFWSLALRFYLLPHLCRKTLEETT